MDCSFSKDVVFELQQSEQTNFHNVLFNLYAHSARFYTFHMESYIFRKEQSIA